MGTAEVEWLDSVAAEHHSSGVWAMFSGGDDSLAAAMLTSRAADFRGCLHIDTGTGVPDTQEFVIETCRREGWPLKIYRAKDYGQDYDALALEYGFPGPAAHYHMYRRLKERPLRAFIRDHKKRRRDRLVLSTGIRQNESQRRMGHAERLRREGVKVWANPIYYWSKADCIDAILAAGMPRNPVVELLHMSGECLCGSFAKPGELKEIELWYPAVGQRIRDLEARVKAAGHDGVWGERPRRRRRQSLIVRTSAGRKVGVLCQQCELFADLESA